MQLLKNLYGYFFYTIIMVFFIPFMFIIWCLLSFPKAYKLAHFIRTWWAKLVLWCCFYFYKVNSETIIDKKRNYVVCFNHTSHLDILLLCAVLHPLFLRFMAKAELGKLPFFGKFFTTLDFSVDRDDANNAKDAFNRADEALSQGHSLAIAPEGGTSKNPPQLRNFKSGAFRLAIQHQVPILVLTFYDNWRILPSNGKKQGWHISRVKIHTPIETKGMKIQQHIELGEKVNQLLTADLKAAFPKHFN
jgi:1-acyl-sn-glycerol-3-phosphate acyltransferase